MVLWQELDLCYDDNWSCTEDSVLFLKRQENDRVFVFLAGLNNCLDEVRGRILGKIPLPILRETFSEVRREEARQSVMLGKSPSITESSAMVAKSNEEGKRDGKKPWHTRDTCWKDVLSRLVLLIRNINLLQALIPYEKACKKRNNAFILFP